MEILKSLDEQQLDSLRATFNGAPHAALDEDAFKRAVRQACNHTGLELTDPYLDQLFASVDVSGRGRVSWSEFSMFAIEQANIAEDNSLTQPQRKRRTRKAQKGSKTSTSKQDAASTDDQSASRVSSPRHQNQKQDQQGGLPSSTRKTAERHSSDNCGDAKIDDALADGGSDEEQSDPEMELDIFATFRPFSVDSLIPHPFGKQVNLVRYFQRQKRLVMSMNDVKGSSHLTVYDVLDGGKGMSVHGRLPKQPELIVDWDMIPVTGGISFSNSVVCAYQGGVVQLFSLQKKHSTDDVLPFCKSLTFSETQTRLVWSSLYNRLLLGSRGGVLSIWDVDGDSIFSQEKLHTEAITKLLVRSGTVFSASLDRFNSVKTVDVENSVVTNSFNDHMLGGATALAVNEEYMFSGGFESKIVQRSLQTPRAQPSFLYDAAEPHTGRLTCLEFLPNSPLLMSSDSHGMLKVWDLRVGACLETLNPSEAAGHKARQEKIARKTLQKQGGRATRGGGDGAQTTRRKSAAAKQVATEVSGTAAVEATVDVGCISSICPIPKLGTVMVTNDSELVTYTSLSSSSPELVDDQRQCRFLLLPSASQVLTVHERGVKLWRLDNGHLIYATSNDLVESDVSSCAIISPLRRQFLLGTMSGEVKAFSVALGQRTMDLGPALHAAALLNKEVLSLYVLPKFRDYASLYIILTHEDGITLCPMSEGPSTSAVVRLHVLTSLLENGRYKIKESRLSEDFTRLLVATTRNCVHLIDLAQVGVAVATYPASAPLENSLFGVLPPLDPFLCRDPDAAARGDDENDARAIRAGAVAATAIWDDSGVSSPVALMATQSRRRHVSSCTSVPSPHGRTNSFVPNDTQETPERLRRQAYWSQLHASLTAPPFGGAPVVGERRDLDGQETDPFSGPKYAVASDAETTGKLRPSASPSSSVHRYLVAVADCLGKVTLGYAQAVRRVTSEPRTDGDKASASARQAQAQSHWQGTHPQVSSLPMSGMVEDAYPLLGEWCAAKTEATWRWIAPRLATDTNTSSATFSGPARGTGGGRSVSRITRASQFGPRQSRVARKSRARNPILGASFLNQVAPVVNSQGSLVTTTTDPKVGQHTAADGALGGVVGVHANTALATEATASRRASDSIVTARVSPVTRPISIRLRRSHWPVVTHMHFFSTYQLLITGNEHGEVRLWDLAGLLLPLSADANTRSGHHAPVLVREWNTSKYGITALLGYEHPDTRLPVIITAGADRAVTVWSADGVVLGTLATGRQMDDRTRGSRFALPPFQLANCGRVDSVVKHWGHLLDYLRARSQELSQWVPVAAAHPARQPSLQSRRPSTDLGRRDVPPLSLTLTGRSQRRASGTRVHSPHRSHSLPESQNSFFLTESSPFEKDGAEQNGCPVSSGAPPTLDRTSVAVRERSTASGYTSKGTATPLLPAPVVIATASGTGDTFHETEAGAILAGLNPTSQYALGIAGAATSVTGSTFGYHREASPSSVCSTPSCYSLSVHSAAAAGADTQALSPLINKTALLAQRKRNGQVEILTAAAATRSPHTLAATGVTKRPWPHAAALARQGVLPPLVSEAKGQPAPPAARRNWGAMPSQVIAAGARRPQRVPSLSSRVSPKEEVVRSSGVVYVGGSSGRGAADARQCATHSSAAVTFTTSLFPPTSPPTARNASSDRRGQSPSERGQALSTRLVLPRL